MDSITQASLGAVVGQTMPHNKAGNRGAIMGAIVATIPDLDVLLTPFFDSLDRISIHRGFSHSLLFCLLATIPILHFCRKWSNWFGNISSIRLSTSIWLCLVTHILLDTFTTYGTQLLLPFSDYRFGFDSITVVDPFYAVPLLIGLILSFDSKYNDRAGVKRLCLISLGISTMYLGYILGVKKLVTQKLESYLFENNISYSRLSTIPVSWGGLKWYGVARDLNYLHLVSYSVAKSDYNNYSRFPIEQASIEKVDKHLADRLKWFAKDNFVVVEVENDIHFHNLQVDMQGPRIIEDQGNRYQAPTAFYYKISRKSDGTYSLESKSH